MGEIFTVTLPDIGEGVAEGEVIEWLKNPNDEVKQDEPIVVVMTDKATVELPAPYPGKLVKQYHKPGNIVAKGKALYDLEVLGPVHTKPKPAPRCVKTSPSQQKTQPEVIEEPSPIQFQESNRQILTTPPVRKLARDLGVDIHLVSGSGKDGRITSEDIKKYLGLGSAASTDQPQTQSKRASPQIQNSTPPLHFEDDEEVPIIGLRNIIYEKMVESKLLIPHFTYSDQLDATRIVQLRENMKRETEAIGIKLTYMPFFIKALSLTIKQFPYANSSVDISKKVLIIHKQQHIGIAMKTPMGLIAPVLRHVENMTLPDIIKSYDSLKTRGMAGELEGADMKDSTITISNFGTLGGLWATPIINYPEVAILGTAKIRKQPVVKNDQVVVRDILNISWSFDHRVIDGDAAAEFSNYFIKLLENPSRLL